MRMEPSPDEATENQPSVGVVVAFQVAPPLGEMYTGPVKATAASLAPSAEEAAFDQLKVGTLLDVHVCAWRLIAVWIKTSESPTCANPRFLEQAKIPTLFAILRGY